MNSKADDKYNTLVTFFKDETGWNKARVKFFSLLICALCKIQTVSFVRLSQGIDGESDRESKLRRIQRFFAGFTIDNDVIARLIYALLPDNPPYNLSLDRTNWMFGRVDINILMISVCYKGVAIPLLWKMLPKKGNSNSDERKELFDRYIALFGEKSIAGLMADREFIGKDWFEYLIFQQILFCIRIKENLWVDVYRRGQVKAFWLFNHLKVNESAQYPKIVCIAGNWVYLTGIKTYNKETHKVEFVIIASYKKTDDVLKNYKDRWQIETMFKAMKTSGFNIEDTHLTDLDRISKLVALVSIAFVWAYKVGINKHLRIKPIHVKKHGRMQYSFIKYGLLHIAHILLNQNNNKELMDVFKFLSCT